MRLAWVETPLPLAESRRPGLAWGALAEVAAAAMELVVLVWPPPVAPLGVDAAEPPPVAEPLGVETIAPPMATAPPPVSDPEFAGS
jgi:hypothetical protein